MSELRAKHRLEIERITNLKQEEMDEVHKRLTMFFCLAVLFGYCVSNITKAFFLLFRRVKQAISKKQETLNTMRQQKEVSKITLT